MKNMYRLLPLALFAANLFAQLPALDKPPQDVDDALRARIKLFYDAHVTRKYRQCEPLIAEDSQDDFYVITKPALDSFRIGSIEYSDNFTKAKAMIIGKMPVMVPMIGVKVMEQPFASFWKLEKGQWFWYYNKGAATDTPSGKAKPAAGPGDPSSLSQNPQAIMDALQSGVKADRTQVELSAGKSENVKFTNTLPGAASLSVVCPIGTLKDAGIAATFDKVELKAKEVATLTLTADPKKHAGEIPLQVIVAPTNQVINLKVTANRP